MEKEARLKFVDVERAARYAKTRYQLVVEPGDLIDAMKDDALPAFCKKVGGSKYWRVAPDAVDDLFAGNTEMLVGAEDKPLGDHDSLSYFGAETRWHQKAYTTLNAMDEWVLTFQHGTEKAESGSQFTTTATVVTSSAARDAAIAEAVLKLGYDPDNPPVHANKGRPGLRSRVKKVLMPNGPNRLFTDHTFKSAWSSYRAARKGALNHER